MGNLISWYNQNRRRIWGFIIAAIVIIAIVYNLILMVSEKNNTVPISSGNNIKEINNEMNSIRVTTTNSIVTGNSDNGSDTVDKLEIIDRFIENCNQKKIEEAYNLISDECKEEMFSSLDLFKNAYYDQIFGGMSKSVTTENWFGDTYKVSFRDDALATGKYDKQSSIQDYITIIKDNEGNYKLNINKYVKRNTLNGSNEMNNISIKAVQSDSYMDYEIYTFEVENNLPFAVKIADLQDEYTMYLTDNNDINYPAYIHEISEPEVIFQGGEKRKVRIKFYNKNISGKKIVNVVFSKIEINYADAVNKRSGSLKIDLQ